MKELENKDIFTGVITQNCEAHWYLYEENKKRKVPTSLICDKDKKFPNKSACFSGLSDSLNKTKNCIYNVINLNKLDILSKDTIIKYLKLLKKYKIIPYYISKKCLDKNTKKFKVILSYRKFTPTQLYICLSMLRNMQEFPSFVENLVHLCYNKEVDFWQAMTLSSIAHINGTGHHFLSYNKCMYGGVKVPTKITEKISINQMIQLRHFISNFKKYDKRSLDKSFTFWNCTDLIKKSFSQKIQYYIPINDLGNKHILNMVYSNSNKVIKQEWKLYNKEKKHEKNIKLDKK